ncbi:MAG: hypothetical protein AB7L84_15350 [Acidimicrobiia bacterium]
MTGAQRPAEGEAPGRGVRAFVALLLVALAVPGFVGFDAWPLTAWRLFSAARGETQVRWEIAAVDTAGTAVPVDLDELPLAFRNAEWPLSGLGGASPARRQAVCEALLDAVVDREPGTTGLQVVRNLRRLVEGPDGWTVVDDRRAELECSGGPG